MPITDYPEGRRTRRIDDPMQNRQAPVFSHPEPKQVARARRSADAFRPSDHYEHLLRLRDSGDPAWQHVPATARIGLGMYESDKANHEQITGGAA